MTSKVFVVQPFLTSYRVPLFDDMADYFDNVTVMAAEASADFGVESKSYKFNLINIKWTKIFGFYSCPFLNFFKDTSGYECIMHFADFRYISLYFSIIRRFISPTKVYLHGQAGYRSDSFIKRIAYFFLVFLTDGYIAYNEYSASCLKKLLPKWLRRKVHFVDNVLYLEPVTGINYIPNNEIAYIGRLRNDSNVEMLVKACKELSLRLHVVGMASLREKKHLLNIHDDIIFHGALFKQDEIRNVLKNSIAGVYPGDAGLSVVHLMSLGLPVIVHSDLKSHKGPEAAYIIDGVNGLLFSRYSVEDLTAKITKISSDLDFRNECACNSLNYFKAISKDSMAKKIACIIKGGEGV